MNNPPDAQPKGVLLNTESFVSTRRALLAVAEATRPMSELNDVAAIASFFRSGQAAARE